MVYVPQKNVRQEDEFGHLAKALNEGVFYFKPLYVAPAKPRIGLVVYADGTSWNPGAGEGLYVFESTGWVGL